MSKFINGLAVVAVNSLMAAAIFGVLTAWLPSDAMQEISGFWTFVIGSAAVTSGLGLMVAGYLKLFARTIP